MNILKFYSGNEYFFNVQIKKINEYVQLMDDDFGIYQRV